jgi:hypothetical protein
VLHRVAAATIKSLLRRIAVPLASPAAEAAGYRGPAPGPASGDGLPGTP